jgi:hypothetical protein
MLQKFVYWTGAFDFVVGAATWAGAMSNPQPAQFVPLMTLGMFLMMAAALLMWASKDLGGRAPVVFWQGLVRLVAVISIFVAVPLGLSQTWEYGIAVFDGIIGITYVIGIKRFTGLSIASLMSCNTVPGGESGGHN